MARYSESWTFKLVRRPTYIQKGGTEILKSSQVDTMLMEAGAKVTDSANSMASSTLRGKGGSLYQYDIKSLDYADGVVVSPANVYGWLDNQKHQTLRKAAGIG